MNGIDEYKRDCTYKDKEGDYFVVMHNSGDAIIIKWDDISYGENKGVSKYTCDTIEQLKESTFVSGPPTLIQPTTPKTLTKSKLLNLLAKAYVDGGYDFDNQKTIDRDEYARKLLKHNL